MNGNRQLAYIRSLQAPLLTVGDLDMIVASLLTELGYVEVVKAWTESKQRRLDADRLGKDG